MKSFIKTIIYLLIFFVIGISCSDNISDKSIQQPLNPNGDSELALLMRAMFDEAQQIKQQIENGKPITINLDHEKILTAHATQPKKAASPEYQAFAKTYLQTIKALQDASPDKKLELYDNMVGNCMTCHQALCPGPMVRIKKLH